MENPSELQPSEPLLPASSDPPAHTADDSPPPVRVSLEVPPGVSVRVTVETAVDGAPAAIQQTIIDGTSTRAPITYTLPAARIEPRTAGLGQAWQTLREGLSALVTPQALFIGGLAVYLATRLYALESFPIYFFGDEAIQTNQAVDFVWRGFRDHLGRYFPTYFQNASFYNLSTSVYLQIIPYLLFGKSVFVTRAVSAVVSLFGAIAVSLTLRDVFRLRDWWAGALLLALTPGWFLYSRTAFENATFASFYAWFLYGYLMYRNGSLRHLFPALGLGALAFYSYKGSQFVIVLTGLLFLLVDARYHWANRRTAAWGAAWLGVLFLPQLRFMIEVPNETFNHLRIIDSYWVNDSFTLAQKLEMFGREYLYGLSPQYWFWPDNGRDLIRHQMKGYGQLPLAAFPLAVLGLLVCLRRALRSPTHRALLVALLAAPTGGALAAIGLGRVLVFIIPATLIIAFGVERALDWATRWSARLWLSLGLFAVLTFGSLRLTWDAVMNGPTWYTNYGLYGMQYGARQVFGEVIPRLLRQDPNVQVAVSPTWANSTDYFKFFFIPREDLGRVQLQSLDYFLYERRNLDANTVLVLPPEEYARALNEPKLADIHVEAVVVYPDGAPGLRFIRLRYSDQAEAIFAQEREERRQPVEATQLIDGQEVTIIHSRLEGGQLSDLFDGDAFTLARGLEANPLVFQFRFPEPRRIPQVTLTLGTMIDFEVILRAYGPQDETPFTYRQRFFNLPADPTITLPLEGAPLVIARLELEIHDYLSGETASIHVREIVLEK